MPERQRSAKLELKTRPLRLNIPQKHVSYPDNPPPKSVFPAWTQVFFFLLLSAFCWGVGNGEEALDILTAKRKIRNMKQPKPLNARILRAFLRVAEGKHVGNLPSLRYDALSFYLDWYLQ